MRSVCQVRGKSIRKNELHSSLSGKSFSGRITEKLSSRDILIYQGQIEVSAAKGCGRSVRRIWFREDRLNYIPGREPRPAAARSRRSRFHPEMRRSGHRISCPPVGPCCNACSESWLNRGRAGSSSVGSSSVGSSSVGSSSVGSSWVDSSWASPGVLPWASSRYRK